MYKQSDQISTLNAFSWHIYIQSLPKKFTFPWTFRAKMEIWESIAQRRGFNNLKYTSNEQLSVDSSLFSKPRGRRFSYRARGFFYLSSYYLLSVHSPICFRSAVLFPHPSPLRLPIKAIAHQSLTVPPHTQHKILYIYPTELAVMQERPLPFTIPSTMINTERKKTGSGKLERWCEAVQSY